MLRKSKGSVRLARPRAASDHDWWQTQADWNLETRQQLPEKAVHPWCANGPPSREGQNVTHYPMVRWLEGKSIRKRCCRGDGKQTRTHRMGRPDERRSIPSQCTRRRMMVTM